MPLRSSIVARFVLWAAIAAPALGLSACRVNDNDIKRWETTELGPTKLYAVVTHDKYDWALRVEAAEALIRMKPRGGRRVGLQCSDQAEKDVCLQRAMAELTAEERKTLIGKLIPIFKREMAKSPTVPQGASAESKIVDESVPYKDAAYAILAYDKPALVADEAQKAELKEILVAWCTSDFDKRIAMTSQLYGLEQVVRMFQADGVKRLPPLVNPESTYDKIAALVAELGDAQTKDATAVELVKVGKYLESAEWFNKKKDAINAQYKANGYDFDAKIAEAQANLNNAKTKEDQDKAKASLERAKNALPGQVELVREEQLTKLFASLKRVGGRPAVDYLLGVVAADKSKPEKRRALALASIEGKVDRSVAADIEKILAIATAEDTPDMVRDLAFQRTAELPREQVAPKLYQIFESPQAKKNWKIRWVAASTILKMSTGKDVPEFLDKLPKGQAPGFTMSEPLTYGDIFGKLKNPPTREQMVEKLTTGSLASKLTAIGYFYGNGKASDTAALQPLESDKTALPKVEEKDSAWQCAVPKEGNPNEKETKPVTTVGEFVKLCIQPNLSRK